MAPGFFTLDSRIEDDVEAFLLRGLWLSKNELFVVMGVLGSSIVDNFGPTAAELIARLQFSEFCELYVLTVVVLAMLATVIDSVADGGIAVAGDDSTVGRIGISASLDLTSCSGTEASS